MLFKKSFSLKEMDVWTVYGKRTCGYTVRAMNLLGGKGIRYNFVDVSDTVARDKIIRASGIKTVPVIYKGKTLIGGCTDLERYLSSSSSSSRSSSHSYSRK
jgi:glutaredoxin